VSSADKHLGCGIRRGRRPCPPVSRPNIAKKASTWLQTRVSRVSKP